MKLVFKYKLSILLLLGISLLFFLFRLPNLTLQPIFADEAIYIRWAQVARAVPELRFISLTDGKTPLFMWVMIPMFKLFSDPLLAGRMLSVLTGFGTMLACFLIGWKFFNIRVGLWAAFLIAISPFTFFFDRMALVDSMLAFFSTVSLGLAALLIQYPRIDLAMVLGYSLGGGMITKTPALFNFLTLPASLVLFNWSGSKRPQRLVKTALLMGISVVIGLAIYNILRLGPGFSTLNGRNQDYVFPISKLWETPFDPLTSHGRDFLKISIRMLGLGFILSIAGIIWALFKRQRTVIFITLWAVFPLLVELSLLKVFTARYVLFTIPPLLIIAAWLIDQLISKIKTNSKVLAGALALVLLLWPAYFGYYLLTDPQNAPLFKNERRGYLEDWTAGVGLREIAVFLENKSKSGPIVVGTEGTFGTLPDGLQIYFDKNPNVIFKGDKATISAELRKTASEHPTYFVANKSRFPNLIIPEAILIKEFPKAVNPKFDQDSTLLFRVLSYEESTKSAQKEPFK